MEIINLGENNSIFNHFISEIRNVEIQNDSMRFRRNMERIGEIFSYEISKKMNYTNTKITTPLGESWENIISEKPVLATILRAGLPLQQILPGRRGAFPAAGGQSRCAAGIAFRAVCRTPLNYAGCCMRPALAPADPARRWVRNRVPGTSVRFE